MPLGTGAAADAGRAVAKRWLLGMAAGPMGAAGPSGTGIGTSSVPGSGRIASPFVSPRGALGGLPLAAGGSVLGRGGAPPGAGGTLPGFGGSPFSMLGGGGRTEFLLPLGGGQEEEDGAAPMRRLTVWGQGDVQTFQGERSAAESYGGDVRTAYVGVDTWLSDRWLAGLAVARSSAGGDWRYGSANGRLATSLTSVEPYLRWTDGDTSVWTTVGGGRGAAENERRLYGLHEDSTLGLRLGLVEVRRGLATVGDGVRLQLRGDASWARLATGAGDEVVDALRVAVHQARVGVEASRPVRTAGRTLLEPFGEAHARRDGGSGQTGAGLELAGGMRVARGAVRIEGLGRLLALHSAAGYGERGAAVTLSVGEGARRPGLSLSLSPRWGDQASARDVLWQEQVYRTRYGAGRDEGGALDARVGYGVRLPAGGLLTPFGAYDRSQYGRRLQTGAVIGPVGNGAGPPLRLEVSGERYWRRGRAGADLRVSVRGRISLGGAARGAGSGATPKSGRWGVPGRARPVAPGAASPPGVPEAESPPRRIH